jgi:hypothetical protein
MKQLLILFCLVTGIFLSSSAQVVVLDEQTPVDSVKNNWGMNRKHYMYAYVRVDMMAGMADKGAGYKFGSGNFDFGVRYKLRLSNHYAVGMDLNIVTAESYKLKDDSLSNLINFSPEMSYKKESLNFTGLGLELYNRFNFGKRGNAIGKYFDIGVYGKFAYATNHYMKGKADSLTSPLYSTFELYERGLKYTKSLYYGVSARIGFNRIAIDAHYRISDLFNDKIAKLPELSRLQIGLEIGLY